MRLNELFEAGTKHVTFCFGRFNPPTIGHEQVFKTMKSQGGEMRIFTSMSQDKKKNPLDYSTKVNFLRKMFPQYASSIVEDSNLNTVVKVAAYLFDQGYTDATFVAGSDRVEDMGKLLKDYNGVEGKSHGYYKFKLLDVVSSGEREDGAEGVAGVSASGARTAAANNEFESFKEATGAGELSKPLFDAVRKGLGVSGSVEENTMKAKEFEVKPRNFVAKNAKMGGAGQHKDKKKAEKQGDFKHKQKQFEQGVAEGMFGIDSKTKGAIQNVVAKLSDIPSMWDHKAQTFTPDGMDKLKAVLKDNPKHIKYALNLTYKDFEADLESVEEGWKSKAAAAALAAANLLGSPVAHAEEPVKPITIAYVKIDGEVRKYNLGDKFENAREAEKFISGVLDKQGLQGYTLDIKHGYPKKKEESMEERIRDPEDWDEGNTEPANNFAVYINGKKWKVIKGKGQYADDMAERNHLRQLNAMAQQKSQATGKKWTIAVTGEAPTA